MPGSRQPEQKPADPIYSQAIALVALGLSPMIVFFDILAIDVDAVGIALAIAMCVAIPATVVGITVYSRPQASTLPYALGIVVAILLAVVGSGFAIFIAMVGKRDSVPGIVLGCAPGLAGFLSLIALHRANSWRSARAA